MNERIDLRPMLDALTLAVDDAHMPGWAAERPDEWAHGRERDRLARSAALGAEIASLHRARALGWSDLPEGVGHNATLVMRLPDGGIGLANHSRDGRDVPPATATDAIVGHLLAIVRGQAASRRPDAPPRLPEVCRRVLAHDGLDPGAVETLADACGRLDLRIGRRRMRALLDGTGKDVAPRTWQDIRFTLSRDPKTAVTGAKLVAAITVPETMAAGLAGRPATVVLDHPALSGMIVQKATAHPRNLVLTLAQERP